MKLDTVKESSTIKAEAYFNKEHTHRYLWRRVWDKDKPLACVITLNPCMADTIVTDTTTYLIVNNVANLERFGGVEIVNLFSMLTKKLNFRWNSTEEMTDETNDGFIQKSANDCESVIIAWGKCAETNTHINERARMFAFYAIATDNVKSTPTAIVFLEQNPDAGFANISTATNNAYEIPELFEKTDITVKAHLERDSKIKDLLADDEDDDENDVEIDVEKEENKD